ncbi:MULTISPECIES: nitrogen regulation protein NR(II) [unclassified Treponema]|uniref:two-component system sensor histidine kinase NtrB n=1 Tax=unclassified Treponema TaxID=2638727 RepID=UPI0020A2F729|nr:MULTISPECIES: ATP-binding protein [unclassified Treponema]UTC68348.1 PAS domain S-box protein [Treponema sp. OMZ 789]UTC71068.1 PAS domain S-box protein [Treponema sp. OMZ 790]UTC73809.1 PAS domain S-box protein [Treponema sp. OMZ 791]
MREFMRRGIQKSPSMNEAQLRTFVKLLANEYSLLDSVMDSLNDGVIVANSENKIIKSNRAAERILGTPLGESHEKNVWEHIKIQDIADFVSYVIENESGQTSKEFNLKAGLPEGKNKYIEVSVLPLVKEKKIQGTIIMIADITEKRSEEIKNRRLENLASLTNVAAAVAHEIKNPLAAISIHLQLLKKNFTACNLSINQKAQKHINVIEEEIERLNKIVVDFLFAVRPLKFEFVPVDINVLLKNLYDTFFDEFNDKGITISLNFSKELPKIQGDERFLRQAFMNVLTNAKSAMPDGGFLDISTKSENDFIFVSISDSGQGILPEDLHKIFEPYFTTKHDGTGLGLTMTYKVIKEHGGDINVYSDYGMGTSFKFSLPIERKGATLLLSDKTSDFDSVKDIK